MSLGKRVNFFVWIEWKHCICRFYAHKFGIFGWEEKNSWVYEVADCARERWKYVALPSFISSKLCPERIAKPKKRSLNPSAIISYNFFSSSHLAVFTYNRLETAAAARFFIFFFSFSYEFCIRTGFRTPLRSWAHFLVSDRCRHSAESAKRNAFE